MEELIELLNEYTKKEKFWIIRKIWEDPIWVYWYVDDKYWLWWASKLVIISKEYWFIKWLVENEKIDIDKMEEKSEYTFLKKRWWEHIIEDVLMLLSIQDEPINFLLEILK